MTATPSTHRESTVEPVTDVTELTALLDRARARGHFDAVPAPARVRTVLTQPGGAACVVRTGGEVVGLGSIGPLGLVGPPSTEAVFMDVVADDDAVERQLTEWALALAAQGSFGDRVRSMRGGELPGPPGFAPVRQIRRMDRDLSQPLTVPTDLVVADYASGGVADEQWIRAINDSFDDHWGGYLPWTIQRWQERMAAADGTLSLLAVRDGEPAGVLLGGVLERDDGGPQPVGFIEVVGTRPAHRRRGIAEFLVRSALSRFAGRGIPRAVLLVDAGSDTRAPDVYFRCGFRDAFTYRVWDSVVRGGAPAEEDWT